MKYNIIADRIEVRSLEVDNKPKYIVKGTAMIAGKKHIYKYKKNLDGTFKTSKSMFTPHCIESIKKQAKDRKMFIDTQHELARDSSIKALTKGKLNPDESKQLDNMLKRKMLPLAKLTNLEIHDDKMEIETEFNPMFREYDEEHRRYFDAIWYSLENKFLNGISVNMANFKIAKDDNGDMVIDDADVLGFSFLDVPAEHENSITEVVIRAMDEENEGGKMKEEKEKLEAEKAELEKEKKKVAEEKESIEKEKKEKETTEKETTEKEAKEKLEKEVEEFKKKKEELDKKATELKEAEEKFNSAKGVVGQQAPPTSGGEGGLKGADFYKEKIEEITKNHRETYELIRSGKAPVIDQTFDGFAQMVFLSAQAGDLTADLDKENAEYIRQNRLLAKGKADMVTPKIKPE